MLCRTSLCIVFFSVSHVTFYKHLNYFVTSPFINILHISLYYTYHGVMGFSDILQQGMSTELYSLFVPKQLIPGYCSSLTMLEPL